MNNQRSNAQLVNNEKVHLSALLGKTNVKWLVFVPNVLRAAGSFALLKKKKRHISLANEGEIVP